MVFVLLPPLCLPQDGGEVFLEVNGIWLDVVFVLLPPLCLPQDGGEVFLDVCGFWLMMELAPHERYIHRQ